MLSKDSPYKMSEEFGLMSEEDVSEDVGRFFIKYTVDKGIYGIEPADVDKVFFMYISRYLIHKDGTASEKLN